MNKNGLTLMDITVKEGGFRIHHHLLPEQVANIARELERSKIGYAEISHGRGIGAKKAGYPGLYSDKGLLKAAREAAPNLKYCVYLASFPYSLLEIESLKDHFDIGRVGVNVDEVDRAKDYIQRLKEHQKMVIGQLLRVHLHNSSETAIAAQKLQEQGADIIYLTDNFGSMAPEEVDKYVRIIKEKISLPIGFQGRNNTKRAIENSLAAFEAGAAWLDASFMGMGQGAGVTPLEVLVSVFHRQGLCLDLDLVELCNAARSYALPALRSTPKIEYIDLLFAKLKLDYYPQEVLTRIADIIEKPLEDFLLGLRETKGARDQLLVEDLRVYLEKDNLDLEVVMNYLKTGEIQLSDKTT